MSQALKREIYIILHGQSVRFRIIKYLILIGITVLLYKFYGSNGILYFYSFAFIFGIAVHLLFRWKTNGWRKSWGLFNTPMKD